MEFRNEFTVKAPIDEVYEALLDPERVAPAMPGAQVLERVSDDVYKVAIKIKLGPVTMTYKGEVEIVDKNPETHTATMSVKAKEARGQGTATAKVEMSLEEHDGETQATMTAHVQLSGKAAAMGRGIIEDVSARLVDTFAANLADLLATSGEPAADETAPAEEAPVATGAATAAEAAKSNGDAKPDVPATSGAAQSEPKDPGSAKAAVKEKVKEQVEKDAAKAGGGKPSTSKPAAAAKPSKPRPAPAPADDEGLPVLPLAASIVADRMKDPKVLGGVLGGVLLIGYLAGRRSG
jgi:carbon monoxide dehydrogenase subunit G